MLGIIKFHEYKTFRRVSKAKIIVQLLRHVVLCISFLTIIQPDFITFLLSITHLKVSCLLVCYEYHKYNNMISTKQEIAAMIASCVYTRRRSLTRHKSGCSNESPQVQGTLNIFIPTYNRFFRDSHHSK